MSWLRNLLSGSREPRDGDELPQDSGATTVGDAIAMAEAEAVRRGIAWPPPIEAKLKVIDHRSRWVIRANAIPGIRGYGVRVIVDDATREVVDVAVTPR